MPNHCSCDLRINGNPEDIQFFFDAVKGNDKPIDEDQLIPYPERFKKLDEEAKIHNDHVQKTGVGNYMTDGYNSGGYEWCLKNWGTKWGMYSFSEVTHYQKSAKVTFSSAWRPPLPLVLKMSELFPKLKFSLRYYEQGSAFKGLYRTKAGQVLEESTDSYSGKRGG